MTPLKHTLYSNKSIDIVSQRCRTQIYEAGLVLRRYTAMNDHPRAFSQYNAAHSFPADLPNLGLLVTVMCSDILSDDDSDDDDAVGFRGTLSMPNGLFALRQVSVKRRRRSFPEVTMYLSENAFSRSFRMPRRVFYRLLDRIHESLKRDAVQAFRSSGGLIDPAVRLAIALRLLAGGSVHDLMMIFSVGRSTVYEILLSSVDTIVSSIPMPSFNLGDEENCREIADGFQSSRICANPLYGCLGALDGLSLEIMKPHDDDCPRNFYCRKGIYALCVQAIVDSRYRFTYMSSVCSGSTHDSVAWACSGLAIHMEKEPICKGFWIAADSAYQYRGGIVTPWSAAALSVSSESIPRDAFNFFHSSIRLHVEQAFGILVSRWGVLWTTIRFALRSASKLLSCCMPLHNYCIENNGPPRASSLTIEEERLSTKAFARWWSAVTHLRNSEKSQGRRRDLEHSELRDVLTSHLRYSHIIRPPNR